MLEQTFYGIASYQCMEATPSLACANKCVFCWRHHDNPVGTSFRWQVDSPTDLVDGFEAQHKQMVRDTRPPRPRRHPPSLAVDSPVGHRCAK